MPSEFLLRINRSASQWFGVCLPTSPKYPQYISCPLLIDYRNHTVCRSAWRCHRLTLYDIALNIFWCRGYWPTLILMMTMFTRTPLRVLIRAPQRVLIQAQWRVLTWCPPRVLTWCPLRMLTQCWPIPLPNSAPYLYRTCPTDMSFGCWISYTLRTDHCCHCRHWSHWSHRSHRSHRGHYSTLSGWVRFCREEASESFESWNSPPESVQCPDPRCVRNTSGTLQPRSYKGSRFDCDLLLLVVKNDI